MTDTPMTNDGANMIAVDRRLLERLATGLKYWSVKLRRKQAVQLEIDPDWTTIEIKPELFNLLVEQLENAGNGVAAMVDPSPR